MSDQSGPLVPEALPPIEGDYIELQTYQKTGGLLKLPEVQDYYIEGDWQWNGR